MNYKWLEWFCSGTGFNFVPMIKLNTQEIWKNFWHYGLKGRKTKFMAKDSEMLCGLLEN